MEKFKKFLYRLLLVLFAGVFLSSAFLLGQYWLQSRQSMGEYEDLAQKVALIQAQQKQENEDAAVSSGETGDTDLKDPDETKVKTVLPEYAPLLEENADLVGWIRIPDTKINYPVMQTPTRPDYYLHRNFQQEDSNHGAIYVDEGCDVNRPSDNITIHGHHMKDGSMFAGLDKFKTKSFWEEHKTFTFDTLTEHHTYEVYAVFLTTASVGEGFDYLEFVDAADEEEFDRFVAEIQKLALYDTGITPKYGDKLLCLSTCEYSQVNGRVVVAARRIS